MSKSKLYKALEIIQAAINQREHSLTLESLYQEETKEEIESLTLAIEILKNNEPNGKP